MRAGTWLFLVCVSIVLMALGHELGAYLIVGLFAYAVGGRFS
jgi:hypothetical protein